MKLKPGSGRLLCHPARKRIASILQLPRPTQQVYWRRYESCRSSKPKLH